MAYFNYNGKNIFYQEMGNGTPLLLLHGNTASSKMFLEIAPKFAESYRVILMDFLGCGQSERVEQLAEDLWYDQAMQVSTFLIEKEYRNVKIIGSSGGALTAMNVALEHPELVDKVIADSFEGVEANVETTKMLEKGRAFSKQNQGARMFYEMMNGPDWEQVVDADTKAVILHAAHIGKFFHRPISELKTDILFTGSSEDEMFPKGHYQVLFGALTKEIINAKEHIFEHGNHLAMLSNQKEFIELSMDFFSI